MAKEIGYTIQAASEGIKLKLSREHKIPPPFSYLRNLFIIANMIRQPKILKEWARYANSNNYGRSLLDQVFPRFDNPGNFNSTPFTTAINDQPVQALSSQEFYDLKEKGIELGLVRKWIEVGFEERAMERGIDLEWSFH